VIVVWVIIWTLLGLFIILAALLLVPVSFSGQAGLEETASFEAALVWAGSLVAFQAAAAGGQPLEMRLRLGRWTRRLQPGKPGQQDGNAKPDMREGAAKRFDLSWIDKVNPYLDRQVFKEVFRYLFRLERSLDLKLRFEGEIGLGDPDLTGHLADLLATLNSGQWECNLQPNFTETVLRFRGTVQGRVLPASLFWLTGRLLLSQPIRKIWWSQFRKTKTKPKVVVNG
jgi:hypothetical protein